MRACYVGNVSKQVLKSGGHSGFFDCSRGMENEEKTDKNGNTQERIERRDATRVIVTVYHYVKEPEGVTENIVDFLDVDENEKFSTQEDIKDSERKEGIRFNRNDDSSLPYSEFLEMHKRELQVKVGDELGLVTIAVDWRLDYQIYPLPPEGWWNGYRYPYPFIA